MPVNGDILKELRKGWKDKYGRKCTQADMALLFGISPSSYSNYETGNKRMPISMLEMLADLFGTSTDYILGRTDNPKPYPKRGARP